MQFFAYRSSEKSVIKITGFQLVQILSYAAIWRIWSVKPYVNVHHLKQLEQLKSEPKGSFLMLSIHLSFEEIIAALNSANPTSAISFLASFTRFSV